MRKHSTGFYLETLLLIVVFIAIILVLTQVYGLGKAESLRAERLTDAVTLASNSAESFSAAASSGVLAESLQLEGSSQVRYNRMLESDPAGDYLVKSAWAPDESGLLRCTVAVYYGNTEEPIYTLETAAYLREAAE